MQLDAIDYFRGFDILLAFACFVLLVARLLIVWKKLTTGQRVLFTAIQCFMLSIIWESFELIVDNEPVTYRIILRTAGLMLMLMYLTEPRSLWRDRMGKDTLSGHDFRADRNTPDATL